MKWGVLLSAVWLVVLGSLITVARPRRARALPLLVVPSATPPRRQLVGAALRKLARRPPDESADLDAGTAVLVALPIGAIEPIWGAMVGVALVTAPVLARRRARVRLSQQVIQELPEVIDLLRLALGSGGSVLAGIRGVSALGDGPVVLALSTAWRRCERGLRLSDALEATVQSTSDDVRPLARALVSSEHYGTELTVTLGRLADEARATRRRRAQTKARTVPVRLLLPLVVCILPAFVLLTLVPTLADTVSNVRLA